MNMRLFLKMSYPQSILAITAHSINSVKRLGLAGESVINLSSWCLQAGKKAKQRSLVECPGALHPPD